MYIYKTCRCTKVARRILLRSPRRQEKFATNCLISGKMQRQKNLKLKAIEILKVTPNYKITGQSLQQLEKHLKPMKYLLNITKIGSNTPGITAEKSKGVTL